MEHFPTTLQEYVHKSRYARWRDDLGRREHWPETVERYIDFFRGRFDSKEIDEKLEEAKEAILNLDVVPSMRALMTAGPALERDNMAGFNCAYIAVDSPRAFDEVLYVLCCGTGVGFSVERQFINQLPEVAEEFEKSDTTIVVRDSKQGWAKGLKELIGLLYQGQIPHWDLSRIRPAGARLKTFGGRASGPEPLQDLFNFTVEIFRGAAGRKLNSLEVHDLLCKIGDIVVSGGVRRSALISLSNLTDRRMAEAKQGQWWVESPQRALANNSVAYTETPDAQTFMEEWLGLVKSRSGERGIFNRNAAKKAAARNGRRDTEWEFGVNPCSEVILRSKQTCNLTELVVEPNDSAEDLRKKAKIAAFLGTLQSTLTDFRYVRKEWKQNCEEERLLGVSMTGIMDNPLTYNNDQLSEMLDQIRDEVVKENEKWADRLGINYSTACSVIKPSGTVSQLVDSASGIHPRYSRYYLRAVRADKKDPLAHMMIDQGFPYEEDYMKPDFNYVFYFPMKAPEQSVKRDDFGPIEQLELWKLYQQNWAEHKPSITVYVRDEEWPEVGAWVYRHFDEMSGVSFLPHTDHVYRQAPYQELTQEEYEQWLEKMPENVNWEKLAEYEKEDHTVASQELACSGPDSCEI